MNDKSYTVLEVQPRNEWTGAHGTFKDYALRLQEVDTGVLLDGWVSLTQKPETPAPAVNATLFGHTESQTSQKGTTYLKFKKAQQQQYSAPGQAASPATPTSLVGADKTLEHIVEVVEEIRDIVKTGDKGESTALSVKDELNGEDFDLSEIPF